MEFRNLKELSKYLQKEIQNSMIQDVGSVVKVTMQQHIEKDVYDNGYTPVEYERRGDIGGLGDQDNIIVTPIGNGIKVDNITKSNSDYLPKGKQPFQIAGVIEYGHDNGYGVYDHPTDDRFTSPRPFIENTIDEIKRDKLHVKTLKASLKAKGIDIK